MREAPEPIFDVAHLGHVELLSPKPEESLWFFRDVLGMQEVARQGQSVYLRAWGEYERYSLKLTEAKQAGAARREVNGADRARRRHGVRHLADIYQ